MSPCSLTAALSAFERADAWRALTRSLLVSAVLRPGPVECPHDAERERTTQASAALNRMGLRLGSLADLGRRARGAGVREIADRGAFVAAAEILKPRREV